MVLIFGFDIIWIDRRCNVANEFEKQKSKAMNPEENRSNIKKVDH
jgi:hypothetical protein